MDRVLNLAGKNSSEIFQLRYPFSLLSFCDYDLSYFAENAIAVCDEALRSGELDFERVTDLRNSLKNMHVYIEHNLRTVYEKIVLDCWIDYVCRRDNVGTSALWNRFIDCKTAFEKAVFVRLCEYRYNKGINEWLNLVRVQDYAKSKVYFLFSRELSGVEEANARRNYFDLMFSVTARELGCRLEDLGVTQVFSVGRLPSAPFMYPNISKDIMKNLLSDFDYSDDYSDIGSYEALSDQIAMDAFSHMKPGLNQEIGSYNMSRSAMEHTPMRIYIPCGLKSVVDLEIDALLESGGWLARCKRCGRYYVRDSEYNEDYCSLPNPGGHTCLEIYEIEHPRSLVTPEMERKCGEITDEMYSRVTSGEMSLKEYESWKLYLEAMKEKVNNGEIQPDDLISFIAYSRSMDISRSNPVVEVRRKETERPQERVVRPFVPERISRSDIERSKDDKPEVPAEPVKPQPRREGFFTSPSVERKKSQGRAPVSHIIRGDETRKSEPQPFQHSFEQAVYENNSRAAEVWQPNPERGFTAFSDKELRSEPQEQRSERQERTGNLGNSRDVKRTVPERGFTAYSGEEFRSEPQEQRSERQERTGNLGNSREEKRTVSERGFTAYGGEEFRSEPQEQRSERQERTGNLGNSRDVKRTVPERGFTAYSGEEFRSEPQEQRSERQERTGNPGNSREEKRTVPEQEFTAFGDDEFRGQFGEPEPEWVEKQHDQPPAAELKNNSASKPKVIKKNAAAISAYGKIAGTPLNRADSSFEAVSRPQESKVEPEPKSEENNSQDKDPFWDIDSIFDVLEQSENDMSRPIGSGYSQEKGEPRYKDAPESAQPEVSAKDNNYQPNADNTEQPLKRNSRSSAKRNSSQQNHSDVSQDEVPSGIWTEERHLYEPDNAETSAHEELNMLKEKKRARSSKTQRLFDAIMREPDDNPNFRKK